MGTENNPVSSSETCIQVGEENIVVDTLSWSNQITSNLIQSTVLKKSGHKVKFIYVEIVFKWQRSKAPNHIVIILM